MAAAHELTESERDDAEKALTEVAARITSRRGGVVHNLPPINEDRVEDSLSSLLRVVDASKDVIAAAVAEIARLNERVAAMKADCEAAVMDRERLRTENRDLAGGIEAAKHELDDARDRMAHAEEISEQIRDQNRDLRRRLVIVGPALAALKVIADGSFRDARDLPPEVP